MKTTLSIAIVARDEADRISGCLKNLDFADEVVVVVDERSSDDTLSIARQFGCRAITKKWMGYAKQKQFAVDQCNNRWVLILDADERVPEGTAKAIRQIIDTPDPDVAAYSVLRKNFFRGRWITSGGWWPDRVVRLVDKTKGSFSRHLVHEQWLVDGTIKELMDAIEHHSFRNFADMIEKLQNYSTLSACQMNKEGCTAYCWTPLSHGIWTFVQCYFLKLGMLEGFDGFMISILNAGGSFMKYAKLRELKMAVTQRYNPNVGLPV